MSVRKIEQSLLLASSNLINNPQSILYNELNLLLVSIKFRRLTVSVNSWRIGIIQEFKVEFNGKN